MTVMKRAAAAALAALLALGHAPAPADAAGPEVVDAATLGCFGRTDFEGAAAGSGAGPAGVFARIASDYAISRAFPVGGIAYFRLARVEIGPDYARRRDGSELYAFILDDKAPRGDVAEFAAVVVDGAVVEWRSVLDSCAS